MIFSIDVEDWSQSVLNKQNPISARVRDTTLRIIDMLDKHQHKATFFIVGNVARKHPDLIRTIADSGHEVASHSDKHDFLFELSPEQLKQDISLSVKLLEDISGQKVLGYRAPDFSIRESMFEWYCEALVENGLKYDSSLFPMKVIKYGMDKYSLKIFDDFQINEHYLSYMQFGRYKLPFFGGGYFRLMPYFMTKKLSGQLDPRSAVFYMHPYEIDTQELAYVKQTHKHIPFKWRVTQFVGRNHVEKKLHQLMKDFKFNSFAREFYTDESLPTQHHTFSNLQGDIIIDSVLSGS